MRELGQALTVDSRKIETARPLRESLYRIMGTLAIGRGVLLLWNEDEGRLDPAVAKGLRPTRALACTLTQANVKALAASPRPFHFQIPRGGTEPVAELLRPAMDKAQLQWIVPLGTGTHLVGLVLLGARVSGEPLAKLELEVLEQMAAALALRLHDARSQRKLAAQVRQLQRLNRQMRQIYFETIHALAGVIDGPEPESQFSHSTRVAALASEMARRLGLPDERRQGLYLAGLLHDIGKQLINEEILGKPGPLEPHERRKVQAHAKAGFELISHLRFPWGDVAEIIRHHHERLDGRGYPDRLRGSQISVEAKILMMAEAFDSMTTNQPWRPQLSFERIVAQIQENLGLQFEPAVVQALCEAVERGLSGEAEEADFVPHLKASFDPDLIRSMLSELRKQLHHPTLRPPAVVIEAVSTSGPK
jgi:putative nucleotidyltransferase with HDIG domain